MAWSSLSVLLVVLCGLSLTQSKLIVNNLRASNLPSNIFATADGYVKVFVDSYSLGQTSVRMNDANPWWGETFHDSGAVENNLLKLEVHDRDLNYDDLLGVCDRQIKIGTHTHNCNLAEGGVLHYTYSLS